jgi:hypothetical protein
LPLPPAGAPADVLQGDNASHLPINDTAHLMRLTRVASRLRETISLKLRHILPFKAFLRNSLLGPVRGYVLCFE